jgi:hypothetical protein
MIVVVVMVVMVPQVPVGTVRTFELSVELGGFDKAGRKQQKHGDRGKQE